MITGAPPGFMRYETDYPAEVVITAPAILRDSVLDEVNAINRKWNEAITPIPDEIWNLMAPDLKNRWHILQPNSTGPCSAFAATKRHDLVASLPPGALSLAFCHRPQDAGGADHLVLLVNFESGVRVLDNLFFDFYPLADCAYTMISRQTWGNPQQWESMGAGA